MCSSLTCVDGVDLVRYLPGGSTRHSLIARTPVSYLGVHRVALDRVAAAHLDGLGDGFGVLARARDRELGQIYVETRGIDARGEVLAHLRRYRAGVLAAL